MLQVIHARTEAHQSHDPSQQPRTRLGCTAGASDEGGDGAGGAREARQA